MHYVYVLKSTVNNNWVYIGRSNDLRKRFGEHNLGKVRSTKCYRPFVLVFYEAYFSKKDAVKREIKLKNHNNKDILKMQIKNSLISS